MKVSFKVIQALFDATAPMSAADLRAAASLERKPVDRALGTLLSSDRVSRKHNGAVYLYFLTPQQKAMWDKAPKRKATPAPPPRKPEKFGTGIGAAALSRRLRFLRDLSGRPAFLGHALLAEIVTDYQRALSRATDAEEARS